MKKTIKVLVLAAVSTLTFASCDELTEIASEMFGSADLIINDPTGGSYYAPDAAGIDTVHFEAGISDVIFKTFNPSELDSTMTGIDTVITIHSAATVAANIDFSNENTLTYPYMAILIADSVAGNYNITPILTEENMLDFRFNHYIKNPTESNLVAIAVSDTSWYLSHSGSITIAQYPAYGYMVSGSFNNVNAYYFTQSMIDEIADMIRNEETVDINTVLHPVVLSGSFECRRANVSQMLDSLQE